MFSDPAGQYVFDLPLGWAYDPERSHLITVLFRPWDRPEEVLSVRALPTFAPPEASVEGWHQALAERCFRPEMLPIRPLKSGGMPAALAEVHDSSSAVHRRFLVVRGTRLDVLAEHRVPEPSVGSGMSPALEALRGSLEVPSNRYLPILEDQNVVVGRLVQARDALSRNELHQALGSAVLAREEARRTYLYSVVENTPFPEIPAIVALVDALILIGQATASLLPLRDAQHLALRALYTLRHLPFVRPDRRRQLGNQLASQLSDVGDLHVAIVDGDAPTSLHLSSGRGLEVLRADRLAEQAQLAYRTGEMAAALAFSEAAVADFVAQLGARVTLEKVPPAFLDKLVAAGVTSPVEQVDAASRILQRFALDALQRELPILSELRSSTGDLVGGIAATEFLVETARRLSRVEKGIQPPEDQPRALAVALLAHSHNLAAVEDEPSLEAAQRALDEAEALLDRLGDEGALRASLCLARAATLHSQRRLDGALETIERGLRAAAAEPDASAETVRELETIRSAFLLNAGRLAEARAVANAVVELPEGDDPRERLRHSSYYLNLANAEIGLGDVEAATRSLGEGLRRTLTVSPLGEETLRILMVASRLFRERDSRLSYELNLAAAAALDARRATIPADQLRVGFDEASRRREVYEDLVGRLVALDAGSEAVAAADRSRARSLLELLAPPESLAEPNAEPPGELPVPGDDVLEVLRAGALYVVQSADAVLARRGVAPPLRAEEVEQLARTIDAPALLIQPVHQQVALLLVRPNGEVESCFSPLPLAEILDLVDAVRSQLYIHSLSRGETSTVEAHPRTDELNDPLARLWEGLIAPVVDSLVDGEPLYLVPYRDLSLVPFGLLRDSNGRPFAQTRGHSIVPSLATLAALRERGSWNRARPGRAYVVGDPAVDPAQLLARLPAARAEAEAVVSSLKAVGVQESGITLRLDTAAHKRSYRTEARGSDLVHLSCHAKLKTPAYTSHLCLAPQGTYDGLLLASEVADVPLDDALVFLGACETGVGRATADGVIGLGRAFLQAGARAVVLSLWKVSDVATAALSSHFYQALLDGQGTTSVEALRQAMLATRDDLEAGRVRDGKGWPLAPHPGNWAPFVVLGDGLAVRYTAQSEGQG